VNKNTGIAIEQGYGHSGTPLGAVEYALVVGYYSARPEGSGSVMGCVPIPRPLPAASCTAATRRRRQYSGSVRYVEVRGVRLSVIGVGTWQFGSQEWGYGRDYASTTAVDITRRALDLGINLIDTAEIYGFGRSERILGRALGDRRHEAFLATKVFPVFPVGPLVIQAARRSMRRLSVDVIDLYQVHWPNPVVPLETTMAGMRRLLHRYLVRHVGVSNFGLGRWQHADRALGSPVFSNQVEYSLVARRAESKLLPWAQSNDRIIIAYSPLAQGFLSARWDGTRRPAGVRATNPLFLSENLERAQPLLDAIREIARAHDALPSQVALAWLIRKPNVVAIPGASNVEQLERNAAAADLELTDDDNHRLTDTANAFQPVTGPAAIPSMLMAGLPGSG
jgi:aryl-alcohol dehydrogenase-like predicted oxidoreductase